MQDPHIERTSTAQASREAQSNAEAIPETPNSVDAAGAPHRRERHRWRLVVGLTGLLGVAWAVAIASRYPNLLPG